MRVIDSENGNLSSQFDIIDAVLEREMNTRFFLIQGLKVNVMNLLKSNKELELKVDKRTQQFIQTIRFLEQSMAEIKE